MNENIILEVSKIIATFELEKYVRLVAIALTAKNNFDETRTKRRYSTVLLLHCIRICLSHMLVPAYHMYASIALR